VEQIQLELKASQSSQQAEAPKADFKSVLKQWWEKAKKEGAKKKHQLDLALFESSPVLTIDPA
jgi:hypothetical protein